MAPASSLGPGPSYTTTLRVEAPISRTLLADVASTVAGAGAVVIGMDLVDTEDRRATADVTLFARDEAHVQSVEAALAAAGVEVRHASDRTFLFHLGGKIDVVPRTPVRTRDDLSMAYTPGVARICEAVAARPADAWNLTGKGNAVAVVTNGTAVLGLGDLGPLPALPVMEGKAVLFRTFGEVNAYPICLDAATADEIVAAVLAISPGFGGINLEDIAAPVCFEVEARLQEALDIPVFHDDQHGTAVVVLAGLLNACRATGRTLSSCRVVVVGIGAAGTAICDILLGAGVGDLVAVDRHGPIGPACNEPHHVRLASRTNRRGVTTLAEAVEGADALVMVSRPGAVPPELVPTMAPRPIVFALANPVPDVDPFSLPEGAVVATGRSDLPNQVNNALCFPGLFRGALDARATSVTGAMKLAAAEAIASVVAPEKLDLGVIIPSIFHEGLHDAVAAAVMEAAVP